MSRSSRAWAVALTAVVVLVAVALGVGVLIGRQGTAGAARASAQRPVSVERDQLAPLFSLPSTTGETVALSSFEGQVVLVNFWATWCPPCRDEMPVIQATHEKYADRGFRVLAVNVQETPGQVEAYARELGLTFPLLLDQRGDVTQTYRVQNLPRSFFLDRAGRVVRIHPGELTPDTMERYLKELL